MGSFEVPPTEKQKPQYHSPKTAEVTHMSLHLIRHLHESLTVVIVIAEAEEDVIDDVRDQNLGKLQSFYKEWLDRT